MPGYVLDDKNGIADVVLWDLDRLTRNIEDFFTYTKDLIKAGITLHLAVEGEKYDYNSEEKWHQRLIAAQAESKRISKRTKRGQRKATALGYHIGKPPWGYKLIHDSDEVNDKGERIICGRLVPDPDLWHHVLKLWSMALNGSTPMRITIYMNQHNVPSPSGGPWTDGTVRYIIKNEKYHGQLFRGKNPQSRLPGPKENAPALILENSHEPAVSFEDWQKANEAIRSRHKSQGPTRSHSSPNPLSNRLKCGECKTAERTYNLEIYRKDGVTRLRCSKKKKMGKDACSFKGAILDDVLQGVSNRLRNHFLTEDNLESIADLVAETSANLLEEYEADKPGIKARRNVIKNEIKNLNDVLQEHAEEVGTPKSTLMTIIGLEREDEELERQEKASKEASEEAFLFVNDRDGIIETALNLKTFTDPEDLEAVRDLMHIFIETVDVFQDGYGVIHYDFPLCSSTSEDGRAKETFFFKQKKRHPSAPESCGLDGITGLHLGLRLLPRFFGGFPRARGATPVNSFQYVPSPPIPPRPRGYTVVLNWHRDSTKDSPAPAGLHRRHGRR